MVVIYTNSTITMQSQSRSPQTSVSKPKQTLRAITSAPANRSSPVETPKRCLDVNRNQEVGFFTDFSSYGQEEPLALEINMRNLENLTLLDNLNSVNGITGIENNENLAFFQDYDGQCNPPFIPDNDDSKEPNVSRTVRVPTSEHVAEIVGRQGCKIKDLRARTNTYIKTPMRTEPPVFVVTGKETAVNLVISEINSAADHFTQIRASRNHHKNGVGGTGEVIKPVTREGDVVLHVTVPYRVVGLVVGLKGQTIKQIQQDTDTFIVTPNRDKAPIFEIRGQPSNVERARVMIERHIEVRTRNCRLQDTTNLQNCEESPRFGSNDYHYSYTESSSSPPNGNVNHLSNNYINNGNSYNSSLHSPNYNHSPPQSTTSNNYNSWRSYSGLLENSSSTSTQNNPIQTWSSATSEYNSIGNGHSSTSMSNMRGIQYSNMSVGSSSNSNGSVSTSPPQDFLSSGSFSNRQIQGHMNGGTNGSSRLNDVDPSCDGSSSFSGFPLFSTSSNTPTKGSLVLSNIIQQSSSTNGSSSVTGSRDMVNGMNGFGSVRNGNDIMSFSTSTSGDFYRGGFAGDHSMFGQIATSSDGNGFPSGESSPASKSCSLSESSGSQGSPTPRMCKVCEEADVVAALVPCGHNHFCMECAETIVNKSSDIDRKCPICSAAVSDVLRILA